LSYSSGTGFFINNQGYIVTNKHVVGDYLEMTVKFKINGKEIQKKAELVGYLMDEDIAIIKIDVKGLVLPTIPYSFTKNELNIGNKIYTLGFPKPGVLGESIKLTEGIVNSTSGFQDNTSEYQISAQIQPGNSGSPMFDSKGNVKGVVYASYEAGQNVNYAIKSAKLIELLNSLKISYNAVESNVSFVQSVSKFQWSICLISVIQKNNSKTLLLTKNFILIKKNYRDILNDIFYFLLPYFFIFFSKTI
jgi:S1-C subfamily serine protease